MIVRCDDCFKEWDMDFDPVACKCDGEEDDNWVLLDDDGNEL